MIDDGEDLETIKKLRAARFWFVPVMGYVSGGAAIIQNQKSWLVLLRLIIEASIYSRVIIYR